MRRDAVTALVVLVVVCVAPAGAQIPLLTRGAEHEKLEYLIGEWKLDTERFIPQLSFEATATYEWAHGGVWLSYVEPVELSGTGTIWNQMMMVYHPRESRWNGAYWDNVSPTIIPFHATWSDDRTLQLDTGETEFAGRAHRIVTTITRLGECRARKEMSWSWDGGDLERVYVSEMTKLGCS